MKKKVLIICNSSSGLNSFRGMLVDELIKKDYAVCAIVPITRDEVEIKAENCLSERGCKLVRLSIDRRGINPVKDFKLFKDYYKSVKENNPDIIITYTIKPNIYGGFICRLLRVPYAVNITGLGSAFENSKLLKKFVIVMYKIACKDAKVVFFENEENRQVFVKEKITEEKQTYRLNGAGVDLDKFKVIDYPESNRINFLFIGRVMAEKGIDELFYAMKKLNSEGINCELNLLGRYEENYKSRIEKYEKEGWLHYLGYKSDVRPYIAKCHCFVLPSWHEGMANTNLECAASGRPIITSNIPGCKEAVIENVSGFLCEKQNIDSLYMAMNKFLSLSNEKQKEMGFAGRKHMEEIFDKKKVVQETINRL